MSTIAESTVGKPVRRQDSGAELSVRNPEKSRAAEGSTAEVLTLGADVDLHAPETRRAALDTLEDGGVVFLPRSGFELTAEEATMISDLRNILKKEPKTGNGRPTIIFEPERGGIAKLNFAFAGWKLVRAEVKSSALPSLEAMMRRFSEWADELIGSLLPRYVSVLERERVTYRPNQRNAVQPLHVDSAYGYPTQGRGMLRIFCNIDPLGRPRVWHIGEPFEPFARRFLPSLAPRNSSWMSSALARLGVVGGSKKPYDLMIAELRGLGKHNEEYQRTAPRRILEFPSGSCWLAITDLVQHGAISGQHSLDRTFLLPADGMNNPSHSSLRILERLSGRQLA